MNIQSKAATAAKPARADRPTAIREALRHLVARRGFHGASMSAVAHEAGVATGTAYVHYASKDELVIAAYAETRTRLGIASASTFNENDSPDDRFRTLWVSAYRHLAADPDQARFLIQVEGSPYAPAAAAASVARESDPLAIAAADPDMARRLLPLPLEILNEIGLSPAIRLAARQFDLSPRQLAVIAAACWHGISRPRS